MNDDFGYLRSVVQTLQRGRPWTDDWLEPWAAGLSVLTALVFKLTGSFYFAVHGVIAGCAAVSFWACGRLLRDRGFARGPAAFVAVLVLSCPTILWKSLEFTGVVLYLPCLLLAVRAAERKSWGVFFGAWLLAASTRQSALVWLVLPLSEVGLIFFAGGVERKTRAWLSPALVVAGGTGAFAGLQRGMNRTHAQSLLTDFGWGHPWMHLTEHVGGERFFGVWLTGGAIFLLAAGLGALACRALREEKAMVSPAGCAWGACALISVWFFPGIAVEHASYVGGGRFYLWGLAVLGAAGWVCGIARLSRPLLATAAASVAVISLRGVVVDYYLLDVAVLGFFCVRRRDDALPEKTIGASRLRRVIACVVLVPMMAFHLSALLGLQRRLDQSHALISLAETALRENTIQVSELSFAPFGYLGWEFFPYHITRSGKEDENLMRLTHYVGRGALEWERRWLRPGNRETRSGFEPVAPRRRIAQERFRHGWLGEAEYTLWRVAPRDPVFAQLKLSPTEYRRPVFPLNDAEWRELVARR